MSLHLGLAKVEFDYDAQTEDELSVREEQVVWILEDEDPDWHKVKIKTSDPSAAAQIGLVPASYIAPCPANRSTQALYDYVPARDEASGELENEEEMEIGEGEHLEVLEEEGDWILCRKTNGTRAVGFVPANYLGEGGDVPEEGQVEPEEEYEQVNEDEEEETYSAAAAPYISPAERSAGAGAVAGDIRTWSVTALDAKKKKKKGTLGIGNGAVFFASESDKTPVQQYPLSTLVSFATEKSKHLHLEFPTSGALHFVISDKHEFEEIVAKIEEGRGGPSEEPSSFSNGVPPPPALNGSSSNGGGAPPPPPPPPPPPVSDSSYIPPPPPIRSASSNAIPPPPIRSAAASPPPAAPTPPPVPSIPITPALSGLSISKQGNALALYDFESAGDDELSLTEGERIEYIPGGSDDAEWAKVRRIGTGEEGVVPASYIEIDDGAEQATLQVPAPPPPPPVAPVPPPAASPSIASPPPIRSAISRAAADQDEQRQAAADEQALKAQIEADAQAVKRREARKLEEKAKQERRAERERRDRLKEAPKAQPIPIPAKRDDIDDDEPPALAARPRDREKDRKGKEMKKPNLNKTRIWKDRTGQFKVEAEFLGLNANKIRLHKINGVIIEVPVEKMSLEDTNYLKEITSGRKSSRDEERSNRRRDEVRSSRLDASSPTARDASRSVVTVAKPKRSDFDWFDFFLNAGCDVDHCTRYARNAEGEGFDADLIPDFEEGNLRSLGLKEGDVVRVKRYIREKYAPAVPNKDKERQAAADREAQIAADALLAQKLSRGEPLPPAPQLFSSGPDGTLKPRRGRRNTAASSNSVNTSALASAASELEKNRSSSPAVRVASPAISDAPPRSNSTQPSQQNGFDDDAWDVKPVAKPTSPPPAPSPAAAAPTPPPVPPAAPAPAPLVPVAEPESTSSPHPEPKRADSNQGLTYNDGLLAGMGIAAKRSSSVPVGAQQQTMQPTGGSFLTPQATGYNPTGPRGPVPPTAANQNLLAPLQPMRTGFSMGMGIQPQATGFGGNPFGDPFAVPGINAQMTGFGGMQQQPLMTGYPAMMSQPTGFNSMMNPMSMQQTGYMPQQQQPSYMQPQQTGFTAQQTGFSSQPMGFMSQQPVTPQQPIQFNPMPPSQTGASTSTSNTVASTGASHNAPTNVFAAMKDGTFAKGSTHLPPQNPDRYDALRPQQTGFGVGQPQPMQSQPTGFMSQPQMMMSQATGFPQQQSYGYPRQF